MKQEKKKVRLFEKVEITDPEYAQKLYGKEESKFKWKLICTGVALIGSIGGYYCFNNTGDSGFLTGLLGTLWLLGIAAVVAAGSFKSLFGIIIKFGKFGWYIVPFAGLDLIGFAFGAVFGVMASLIFPVIPCAITLYQSYKNMNDAKDYLALWNHSTVQTANNEEDSIV